MWRLAWCLIHGSEGTPFFVFLKYHCTSSLRSFFQIASSLHVGIFTISKFHFYLLFSFLHPELPLYSWGITFSLIVKCHRSILYLKGFLRTPTNLYSEVPLLDTKFCLLFGFHIWKIFISIWITYGNWKYCREYGLY